MAGAEDNDAGVANEWTQAADGDDIRLLREYHGYDLSLRLPPRQTRWVIEGMPQDGGGHGYVSGYVEGGLRERAAARDRALEIVDEAARPGFVALGPDEWSPAQDGGWQATFKGVLLTCQFEERRRAWLVSAQRLMFGGRPVAEWFPGSADEPVAPRARARELAARALRQVNGIVFGH